MKGDKLVTAVLAVILGFLISMGSVGAMATAFSLGSWELGAVAAACAASAIFCAACFSWKRGGVLVLLGAALAGGYLWRLGTFSQQFWQLVYRMSHVYDQAYHWGVLRLVDTAWDGGTVELPLAVFGAVLAGTAVWAVCRGQSVALPVCMSLVPLLTCVVVTDTVPGIPYLFLLLLGQILLLLSSGVRKDDGFQGNRMVFMTALPTALALGLLFLAMPRESYENPTAALRERMVSWAQELPRRGGEVLQELGTVSVPVKAPPSQVDLSTLGRRIESTAPVLYAAAETGGTLYLREQDYDLYDGRQWQSSPHRVEEFRYAGVNLGYVALETPGERELLCLPYYPQVGLSLIDGKYRNSQLAKNYSFVRLGLPDNWRELAAAGEADKPVLPYAAVEELRYLSLPAQTRTGAQALLAPVLEGMNATADKAQAIAAFVQGSAAYDKDPSRMPEGAQDFALWFLEEGERGYCVHFATSAVVLLRAAGIEARYVSGYMLSARSGETETVTGEHAHAWAEYYEPGLDAWLVLEATPGDDLSHVPEETASGETAPLTAPTETAPPPSEAPAEGTDVPTLPETVPVTEPEAEAPQRTPPAWLGRLGRALGALILFAALAEGQRWLRIRLRRMSQRRGNPNRRALKRWRETELTAARLRETPPGELRGLALKAKFSQHTLEAEELARFDGYLEDARQRLREKAWYLQILYRYIYALY